MSPVILHFRFVPTIGDCFEVTQEFNTDPAVENTYLVELLKRHHEVPISNTETVRQYFLIKTLPYMVKIAMQTPMFYTNDGKLYNGNVDIAATTIPASDIGNSNAIPGNFLTDDGQGLMSAGFFALSFTDEDGNRLIAAGDVDVIVPADAFPTDMQLWALDPMSAEWILMSNMEPSGDFVVGRIDFRRDWIWFNFDIREEQCFVKVRGFQDDGNFVLANQLNQFEVKMITRQPSTFYMQATSATGEPVNGACIRSVCQVRGRTVVYTGELTAAIGALPLLSAEEADSSLDAGQILTYNYQRPDVTSITFNNLVNSNGPIYRTYDECFFAPFDDPHFRFYRQPCLLRCLPPYEPNEDCSACVCPEPLVEYNIRVTSEAGIPVVGASISQRDVLVDVTDEQGRATLCRAEVQDDPIGVSKETFVNVTQDLERETLVILPLGNHSV